MICSAAFETSTIRRAEHSGSSHDYACWRSVRADLVRRTNLGRQETNLVTDNHAILLNMQGAAREGEDYLDGRRVGFKQRPPGSLSFIPAGHSWTGWDDGDPTASYLLLTVCKKSVEDHFENAPGTDLKRLTPTLGFEDPLIQYAARGIASEIRARDTLSAMTVENHIRTIFVRLLRLSGQEQHYVKGGLSASVLKRLMDMIDARFNGSLTVAELAQEAGLSEHFLSKAFRQSTGLPPHAFIIRRRVERAGEMLRHSEHSITEIAYACGFSSPSHLAAAFRRVKGTTPKQHRSEWKTQIR